jgi:hypothetical protein
MSDWWAGIAPAELTVSCDGHQHRIRWQEGRLLALDHGQLDDERTLAALGGAELECLELIGAWERHREDLRALATGPRGGTDEVSVDNGNGSVPRTSRRRRRGGGTFVTMVGSHGVSGGGRAPSRFAADPDDDLSPLLALIQLGGGFGERLVATVAAAWVERVRAEDERAHWARAQLRAALYGRVFAALRPWLGSPELSLKLQMVPEDGPRQLERFGDVVRATLPFGWLVDVWAPSLPVVQGRFCLSAETHDGRDWVLTTIAPDLRTIERVELRIRPGAEPA